MKSKRIKLVYLILFFILGFVLINLIKFKFIKNETEIVTYYGKNGLYSITFTRFKNYDSFMEAKPNEILIYNSEEEIKKMQIGFIVGEIQIKPEVGIEISMDKTLEGCNLLMTKKSGFTTNAYATKLNDTNSLHFISYDVDDFSKNIYKNVNLKFEDFDVPISIEITNENID